LASCSQIDLQASDESQSKISLAFVSICWFLTLRILSLTKLDGEFNELQMDENRLIIGYSNKRAKKDKYNREKGVKRLHKAYNSGNINKENINKRGYNKFLEISDNIKVTINQQKIIEDEKWDGLKGYLTNTSLPAKEVYEQYNGLWVIENAFRVTKGTIEIRPMFHFTTRRIEAHVCLCFVAYKVYKELERILKITRINLSVGKVLDIAKTIITIVLIESSIAPFLFIIMLLEFVEVDLKVSQMIVILAFLQLPLKQA